MSGLACVLWWLVLGALLGVLGSWLIGRKFRSQMPEPTERVVEKLVDRPVDRVVEKIVEKLVPDSVGLAERDARLHALQARIDSLEVETTGLRMPPLNLAAAKAAGFTVKGEDDLEIVEGIGPKIAELLHADGIRTFAELAETTLERIQGVLDKAGPNFRMADPQTWSEQSALAAMNQWRALKALQDVLNAGKR